MTVIRHRTIRVYDLDVFVREAGDPGRQTAVLLHGFPASSRQLINNPRVPTLLRGLP